MTGMAHLGVCLLVKRSSSCTNSVTRVTVLASADQKRVCIMPSEEVVMTRRSNPARTGAALIVMVATASLPGVGWAQAPVTSFDEVSTRLKVADNVKVTDTAGRKVQGYIRDLSPSGITVQTAESTGSGVSSVGEVVFPAAAVKTIELRQRDSLKNGTWIGFGIGAGLGLIGSLGACTDGCSGTTLLALPLLAGEFALIGMGIDALIKRDVLVYRASSSPPTARISIAPILLPTRQGVAVRVIF
jgi:hypothetical protein